MGPFRRTDHYSIAMCENGKECSSKNAFELPPKRRRRYSKWKRDYQLGKELDGTVYGQYLEEYNFKPACYDGDIILRPLLINRTGRGQYKKTPTGDCKPTSIGHGKPVTGGQCKPGSQSLTISDGNIGPGCIAGAFTDWHSYRTGYRSSPNRLSPCLRTLSMILLVIFSLGSLSTLGQCQSVLSTGPKGTTLANASNTSGPSIDILPIDKRDQQNRKERHSLHPRNVDIGHQTGHWPSNDEGGQEQRMSKSAFRQLSRLAFKALISEDYQDRALRPPPGDSEKDVTAEGKRQIRRQQRKERQRQLRRENDPDLLPPAEDYNRAESEEPDQSSNDGRIPGRRRAIAIATKDSIKPDSCRTVPLKQRVRMAGCTTKIVLNHFCYGQCNSFYIPKLSKKRLRAAFESCSVCRPKTYVPVAITLHCPTRNPPYVKRKIMKVKECSCMSPNDVIQP